MHAGCYYGLAASLMFSRKQVMHGLDHPKNGGRCCMQKLQVFVMVALRH